VFVSSFTPEEARLFEAVFVRLAATLQASDNVLANAIDPAVPGSPNHSARSNRVWDAYEQVGPLLYSAEDHLRTIQVLLESPQVPTYSLYTLARAAGEAIVRCAYLLDPAINERGRMARGLNIRLESLVEQNKFKRDDDLFAARVATLESRAIKNGIAVFKPEGKPATAFGEHRKRGVVLFRDYIRGIRDELGEKQPFGEFVYRFLSAHAHSTVWVKLVGVEKEHTDEPGMTSVKLDIKFEWLALILSVLLRAHEQSLLWLLQLSGYPALVWNEAMRSATSVARARFERLVRPKAHVEGAVSPPWRT
jgi:hypothetical protein